MAADIRLPTDMYMALMESERKLSELDPLYDKAEECGIDCQQFREVRGLLAQRSEAIRRHFGPVQKRNASEQGG